MVCCLLTVITLLTKFFIVMIFIDVKILNIAECLMLIMFLFHFHSILSRDATSCLTHSNHIITLSDTYPGSVWRNSEEASGAVNTSQFFLLWAAELLGPGALEVNETRPNLASTASRVARNQSETPSLFRAPWTLRSASGTNAFLATLRSWRESGRGDKIS